MGLRTRMREGERYLVSREVLDRHSQALRPLVDYPTLKAQQERRREKRQKEWGEDHRGE